MRGDAQIRFQRISNNSPHFNRGVGVSIKLSGKSSGNLLFDLYHIRYNAANRGAEDDIFPLLPEGRPGIVAFQTTRRMSLVKSGKIPGEEKRPTAGDCYRFALSNPYVDVITSAPSTKAQMEENLAEVDKGPMTEDEMSWMRSIGDYVYGRRK